MISRRALNQKGDTIVEVLIAVVIVSSVLVGAFTISNLSLKQIRMSQERSEAQKVAQQFAESIDSLTLSNTTILSEVASPGSEFCINPTTNTKQAVGALSCKVLPRYNNKVQRLGPANSKSFKITVWWDGLKGTREEVVYYYRIPGK